MKYKMIVKVGRNGEEHTFNLNCKFFIIDENDYGNKHYLHILDPNPNLRFEQMLDIRYDRTFSVNIKKEPYLIDWANSYWSGKGCAWTIKKLEIFKVENF